jgi:hypothetical protein
MTMSNSPADTTNIALENTVTQAPELVSLTDWAMESDKDEPRSPLTVLTLRSEPDYISLFTDQTVKVTTHYLPPTDTWAGGYVYCLGQDCPACAAEVDRKRFMLLPVADLGDRNTIIKVLRVPVEKGPGKLGTELVKVLSLPSRADIVTKINRISYHQYVVAAHREAALNPDVAAAIKRFIEEPEAGLVDLRSVITTMPASEMAQHERIARRLELEGRRT